MSLSARTNPGFGSGPPRYPGTFLLAFRGAVAGLNWTVSRWLGDAVECKDAAGKEHVVGLENLFRRARRTPRTEWQELVVEFLTSAVVADQDQELPKDLAAVADKLLIRVGPPFSRRSHEAELWSQPIENTPLVVNLVIDFPQRMIYVARQLVDDSGQPGAHWLRVALENLKQRTPAEAFQPVHAESGLLACAVGDAYDSSRALLLDGLLPDGKEDGYFVALPSRDQLLVLPVVGEALAFVHFLKILVDKQYKTLPYPISQQVFWVRDGNWLPFVIEIDGSNVTIQPPEEFSEVLERLAPPDFLDGEGEDEGDDEDEDEEDEDEDDDDDEDEDYDAELTDDDDDDDEDEDEEDDEDEDEGGFGKR
ncbi:MAG: hypothetical protein JNM56_01745 [Planctomycetia bacterium]|nr:hypothetical protein [Planctomycetia bacterium]